MPGSVKGALLGEVRSGPLSSVSLSSKPILYLSMATPLLTLFPASTPPRLSLGLTYLAVLYISEIPSPAGDFVDHVQVS